MDQSGDAVPIADLLDERRHLLEVACRMLGHAREAEDAIAETYRRWYALPDTDRAHVGEPRAWLTRTTRAVCLPRLGLPTRLDTDPGRGHPQNSQDTFDDEATPALPNAPQTVPPGERAVLPDDDVRTVSPATTADAAGRAEPDGVDPAERARVSLRAARTRPTPVGQHDLVVHAVHEACAAGDRTRLASLLTTDVTAFYDGGGRIRALPRPLHGNRQVAAGLLTLLARRPRTTTHPHSVNGRTGLLVRCDGVVAAVISLDVAGPHVIQVWVVLNPDKLRPWNRTAPLPAGPDDVPD
ncbi:sigma factor [Streptomyces sp. NPDC059805]|uniref:sigma factor n=1 Tax=unclassified Streptomyces TaxID=2593676 RepID=UPI0036557857